MIIEGFDISRHGNPAVRVSDDFRTESFSLLTRNVLPYTHQFKSMSLWKINDGAKTRIENEIREYIAEFGTEKQKRIVFGKEYATNGNR